jgi:hypothetical protein
MDVKRLYNGSDGELIKKVGYCDRPFRDKTK